MPARAATRTGSLIALFLAALLAAGGAMGLGGCKGGAAEPGSAGVAAPPAAPFDREAALESFDVVWTTVKEKHWDPTLGGLDWDGVRAELRPRVEGATTMAGARGAMQEMLGRLGQSHFGIWPREVYVREEGDAGGAGEGGGGGKKGERKEIVAKPGRDRGVSGLDVRMIEGRAVVSSVRAGSAGEAAGVKPGWVIVGVDGERVASLVAKVEAAKSEERERRYATTMMVKHMLTGDVGETVEVEFLDAADAPVSRELTLGETSGKAARLGNLPTFYMTIDSRRLEGEVQYFGFSMFLDPMRLMGEFQKAVEGAEGAKGFVVDLRGNPGGIGGLAMGLGGWFVEEEDIKLGTMYTRDGTLNFVLNPRLRAFMGPVAILVDGMSGSTSEIYAGGMKDIGRARIFGERTMGAALPSVIDVLPNGDRFQYAIANYVSVGGKPLEGDGVEPDEVVRLDRASLLAGHDPVLEAALAWIRGGGSGAAGGGVTGTR